LEIERQNLEEQWFGIIMLVAQARYLPLVFPLPDRLTCDQIAQYTFGGLSTN